MQKVLLILLAGIVVAFAGIPDKRLLDLDITGLAKTSSDFNFRSFSNSCLEATLISGGYFTIGTTSGTLDSPLDDHCALTFGHPYAKTSYPVFSIDGSWYKLDEYVFNSIENILEQTGDTLIMTLEDEDLLKIEFCIFPGVSNQKINMTLNITNLDAIPHNFGAGLVVDAGLGKWGDGFIYFDDVFITDDVAIMDWTNNQPLIFYEKSKGARGLNFTMDFDSLPPDKVIIANWSDLYENPGPEFTENPLGKIYDLTTKLVWKEKEIAPLNSYTAHSIISLKEGDFSSHAFMRWDLASFLTMENNRLFPRNYETSFEVYNLTDSNLENVELILDIPIGFSLGDSESHIAIPSGLPAYPQVNLQSNLVYEDYIVGLTARLEEDGVILDEIFRNIYIPATPVSDVGLSVEIDSVISSGFPEMQFIFDVKNEENEYLISNIKKENIFLYENESRIDNYTLMPDTTEGISSADIIFVLDVTGSMGNEIAEVKENIIEFADSLERRGINYRLGMVTFLDEIENIYNFTNDVQIFQGYAAEQYAHGGGDSPENSLEALMAASQFDFRPNAKRVIIWITDNSYHETDNVTSLSRNEVIDELLSNEITAHCIGPENFKSAYYDPIIIATGGDYFDIYGNFRDILLKISRFNSSGKFLIKYNSEFTVAATNQVKLDIRYEGLGGSAIFDYNVSGGIPAQNMSLNCYPNPFNPSITFKIANQDFINGNIAIFNVLGQRVKRIPITKDSPHQITWNGQNEQGKSIVSGLYIVQLSLTGSDGKLYRESARILHLK